jgi:hypothetical protein
MENKAQKDLASSSVHEVGSGTRFECGPSEANVTVSIPVLFASMQLLSALGRQY